VSILNWHSDFLSYFSIVGEDIDWSGLRAAAVAIGIRKAARQAACDLPPDEQERFLQRAMKRCSREKWLAKSQQVKADAVAISPTALSANVRKGADVLAQTLAERRQNSSLHLAKYAEESGKRLAESKGDLSNARSFQQIAAGRANLFPDAQRNIQVGVNVLNYAAITPVEREDQTSAESR